MAKVFRSYSGSRSTRHPWPFHRSAAGCQSGVSTIPTAQRPVRPEGVAAVRVATRVGSPTRTQSCPSNRYARPPLRLPFGV